MADKGNLNTSPYDKVVLAIDVAAGTDTPYPLSFLNDSNLGIYRKSADVLAIGAGGIEAAVVSSTGVSITGYIVNTLANYSAVSGSIAAATTISTPIAYVHSAVANGGITLPLASTVGIGGSVVIWNAGASAARIYGSGSDTIDGVAGTTGVVLTNAKRAQFLVVAAATYVSAQLGAVSA